MNRRAYSFLEIKSVDEERREISGWASRPETDRHGDIVEPMGMAPPRGTVPMLLDHNHTQAVGTIIELKPSREGVRFRAKLAMIATPGPLRDLCDSAWEMVKSKLRPATSIGFKPLEMEPSGDGWRFKRWEILELSLVSVPAAAGATIDQIKAADRAALAANRPPYRVVKLDRPVSHAIVAEMDRNVAPTKGLRDADDMLARSLGAAAKATDDCLGQLDDRLTRVEQQLQPAKDVLDMNPDEFLAHVKAQRRLGRAA